jgi:hypothetical protein
VRFATKDAEYARKKADDADALVKEMTERTVELESSVSASAEEKRRQDAEAAALRAEIAALTARSTDLMRRLAAESETVRQTLESALGSSVRLCVVAPTVNVHVADSKLKMRSSLPENAIRDFIQEEVLKRYTFLFKQEHEAAGPPDGSPEAGDLQAWVQKMLFLMQDSIEHHVEAAMNGN